MWLLVRIFAVLAVVFRSVNAIDHPEEMVNLLAGSFTDGDRFSTGNTLPLVGRPWGFNHWSVMTKEGSRRTGSWWFKGSDHQLTWLRCTHQPSPWIGDWGWFIFTPQIGQVTRNPVHFWEPRGAVLKPHLMDITVAPYGIRMELTPTDHGSYLRVTFPSNSASGDREERHICFAEARFDGEAQGDNYKDGTGKYFEGRATQVNSDRMLVSNFALYLRAESKEATRIVAQDDMRCFSYDAKATVVHVRIGTSLISHKQALLNLRREIKPKKTFDAVALDAKMVWNKMLRRVDVVDAGDVSDSSNRHLDIFYTGLYRALTFPRRIDEVDEKGNVVHYSPYDPHGGTHPGPLVTDNGFWDTFRTVYPLLSLAYPDHLGHIVQGWLNAYKEGGWLPSWASPGYRNCMVGTFADVVVADAIVKNVPNFDLTLAKEALLKDSFVDPPSYSGGSVGKSGLPTYQEAGYFSTHNGQGSDAVSRTLDYGFADYSTAQAFTVLATKLGASELREKANVLTQRSKRAYTTLFDRSRGLMVPKTNGGQTTPGFAPIEWGKGYTEGNAWHHSFPPYAITTGGLIELFGGKQNLLAKLHELLVIPSNFRVGSYNQEIHEMTEMRALAMGQYGHNNQPCHHILYLFALLGDAATTQSAVRAVMDRAYGRDFYAGDEDNGEQGAWYVLSALGLYVVTPGTPDYVLGSPVFRHVRISRNAEPYDSYYTTSYEQAAASTKAVAVDAHKYLDIIALGTGPGTVYVDQVTLNNKPVAGVTVDDASLQQDAVLRFIMRGEENSHEVEHHVQTVHMTTTAQLEERLRVGANSANLEEDEEKMRKYAKLEQDLLASASTIKELSDKVAQLSQLKNSGAAAPKSVSTAQTAPIAPSAGLASGPAPGTITVVSSLVPGDIDDNIVVRSFLMDIVLWVVGLLLAVEALDFLAHITMTSHHHPVSGGSAGSSFTGLDTTTGAVSAGGLGVKDGAAPGGDEDFELIQSHSPRSSPSESGVAGSTAAGAAGAGTDNDVPGTRDTAFAASLSLNDFNSPAKVSSGANVNRLFYATPGSSASILSNYLNNRKYGRGSIGMLILGVYYISQVFSEVYWRLYFCSFGRRPRVQESMLSDASAMQGGFSSKKGRKLVAHTV